MTTGSSCPLKSKTCRSGFLIMSHSFRGVEEAMPVVYFHSALDTGGASLNLPTTTSMQKASASCVGGWLLSGENLPPNEIGGVRLTVRDE